MRFLDGRVALFVLLTDVQEPDAGLRPVQHVAHIDRAEVREADELAGVAVHVGSAVDHQHWMDRGREQRTDRRPLHPLVQPQQQRRGRHHRAGVARGDEGVRFPLLLQPEPDRYGGPWFALDRRERLLAHAHDLGCLDDLEPAAIDRSVGLERRVDVGRPADELDPEARRQVAQGQHCPLHFYARRVVATHRIQRDPNHRQASSTGTRCSSR